MANNTKAHAGSPRATSFIQEKDQHEDRRRVLGLNLANWEGWEEGEGRDEEEEEEGGTRTLLTQD